MVTDAPHPLPEPEAANALPRCEPRIEDELVIREEVGAFIKSAGADLQALHAAVTRFVVHCRDRGEPVERIIVTIKDIIGEAIRRTHDEESISSLFV